MMFPSMATNSTIIEAHHPAHLTVEPLGDLMLKCVKPLRHPVLEGVETGP